MRVIGGKHRSRKLLMVESEFTRETKDRVKETVFNMIGPFQSMNKVLDLFAGSGSLGIEAISRGANDVVFVDKNRLAIDVINKNINTIGLSSSSTVTLQDAFVYLDQTRTVFDVIFLDPPYGEVSLDDLLVKIASNHLLHPEGLIVILCDQHTSLTDSKEFDIVKEKRITRTKVIFLKGRN